MRQIHKLMKDWIFINHHNKKRPIDLPHTWNNIDGQDGGNDYYRGTCTYIKSFKSPQFDINKQSVYLEFEGVNSSAKVFLNGKEVCTHDNGYSTFRVEITKILNETNELKVEVDNSVNSRVYPQKADFTFYGGIYRDVKLIIVSKEHFDMDYFGSQSIKIDTEVEKNTGVIKVETYTNCKLEAEKRVEISVVDAQGNVVDTKIAKVVDERMPSIQRATIRVKNAHLWNGIKDPYLYTIKATLLNNVEKLDEVEVKCGIRTFKMDPQKGFFLNGKKYPLHGVSRHQDWKGIGNAISYQQMEQDMDMIREVGANTIRLAHYQHCQYFYDLCDKYGMVVWAEIPYISEHMPNGRENTFSQMKELIIQNYNHPCIVTWGLSNEITISRKHKKDMLDNHHKLQAFVKELDSTRPTTLACYAMCHPFHPVTKITDIVGWNLYLGWYVPGLFLNDLFMKFYHLIYPKRCLCYSEYGAEGMPNLHSNNPKRGDHTEEYQAIYHEYMLKCFERHPFLWATYVWNMFDFAADARDQGGEAGMNHKGLVTFDRKIKKDSFYIYKAWWSDEPFIHLCGKRYEYRSEKITEIKVYTNQKEVTLYNNGKKIDSKKGEHVFTFKLELQEENNIEVKTRNCQDMATIYKTDYPRPEYKVKKGKSQNWV